ncbi:MAG: ABC transporter permease subunit [Granulosicoccaceae bacterium]
MAVLTIAHLELFRLFGTKRGWIATIALLLIWAMIICYVIYPAADLLSSSETASFAGLVLEWLGLDEVTRWPSAEISLYWMLSLYMLPYFCIVMAADQIASDKFRGTLRYITLRTSRTSIFFGRFLGQAFIQFLLVAVTLATVVALVAWRAPDQLNSVFGSVPVVLSNLFIVLMPYIALMSLVSVVAKSAIQAILFAVIAWILVLIIVGVVQSSIGPIEFLDWLLPGSQVSMLLKLSGWQTMQLAVIPVMQTGVLLGMGWFAMQRCDL